MADKFISQLSPAAQVNPADLFVLEQSGTAKKLTGQVLENWLLQMADGHGGIRTLTKTGTSGLVDIYTITFADAATSTFTVTNGKSLSGITQYFAVSNSSSSVPSSWSTSRQSLTTTNKYLWSYFRFAYNDNTYTDTTKSVIGVYGDTGLQTYVWIRWSSVPNPSNYDIGQNPDEYIGIYVGTASTAPTTASSYTWYQYKGAKGDKGDNAIIASSSIRYQASADSTIIPGGTWTSTIPSVPQGQYLWTQTTINFNTGDPIVFYSVARFGIDGTGSVVTVNGVSPDETGNVQLEFGSVSTVNGISPDAGKNIQITASNIQTDDNQSIQAHISELTNRAIPSNPNLLDNPWFTVNQREVETFSVGAYGVDRWKLVSGSATVMADGIRVRGTLRQILEYPVGTNVTASVRMYSGAATASYDDSTKYFDITSNGGVIRAAKLEVGTVSTLANDAPPNYAAELLKCQRYFFRLNNEGDYSVGAGWGYGQFVIVPIFLPTEMRAIPAISYNSLTGRRVVYGNSTYSITGIEVNSANNNILQIQCSVASGLPTWHVSAVRFGNDGYTDFIADL